MSEPLKAIEKSIELNSNDIDALKHLTDGERLQVKAFLYQSGPSGMVSRLFEQGYINSEFDEQITLSKAGRKAKRLGGHDKYIRDKSDKQELDESIKKYTVFSAKWTPILALVTVLITGYSLYKQITTEKAEAKKLQEQQTKVKSLDSSMQIYQARLDSLARANDDLKKKASDSSTH